jgi:hypothetical protein
MPYYEYEIILEEIKIIQKEQEEQRKSQEAEHNKMKQAYNPSSMMRGMNQNMQMPKVSLPKF